MAAAKKRKVALCVLIDLIMDDDDEDDHGQPVKRGPDRAWMKKRKQKGAYENIVMELAVEDTAAFKEFMRMNYEQFKELVCYIEQKIAKQPTQMRKPVSAAERVALTVRFLATGETFRSLYFQFRISRKAVSYIIIEVCEAIFAILGPLYMKFPTSEADWRKIESSFREKWQFPHCLGAVDGRHLVMKSCGCGSKYFNYKGTHSIALLCLAGGDYKVIWADVGMNGRISDGSIWNRSSLGQKLEDGKLNLPAPEPLPNRRESTPYVFVGDDAFALRENFMKPYSHSNLDLFTRVCNYRFSRARRISEMCLTFWQTDGVSTCRQ